MSQTTKPTPDTRGRHALLAILDGKDQTVLAEETGVAQPTLSLIKDLKRLPGRETIAKLIPLGIEFSWWGEPPTKEQVNANKAREAKGAA